MTSKGVPIEMIRHSNLEMLEHKIKSLYDKHDKIWYMIDGVYSMYGDIAPIDEINKLLARYDKLHLYVDDAHGMSWYGTHGCGRLFTKCVENGKTMYMTTLAKGFGTMGGIAVFPNQDWYKKVILHGGPLAYSHPLPPPMMGAAIASAEIHLSPEIQIIQQSLKTKLDYANELFAQTNIPVLSNPETPIYFVGTGQPSVGYNLNKRVLDEGFYVNIGMFPAVPVKNTGLRFTVTNHNSKEQLKAFIDTLVHHYPLALAEEAKTLNDVQRAFRLPETETINSAPTIQNDVAHFTITRASTISEIPKEQWDKYMAEKSICDWNNMSMLEKSFSNNEKPEENWEFFYLVIQDTATQEIMLCTFFTIGLFKDDLLAPENVSRKIEEKRSEEPYYLTSKTLTMGSLVTEGDHLYLNRTHKRWNEALEIMLAEISKIQDKNNINTLILRDFNADDQALSDLFYEHGFTKINMPDSNEVENLDLSTTETFLAGLSKNGRSNIKRYVLKNEPLFDMEVKSSLTQAEADEFYASYEQVRGKNFAVNIFPYPKTFFDQMSATDNWEFLIARMKSTGEIASYGACYKAKAAYCPVVIGMNYEYNITNKVYKQMLYQAIKRAFNLGYQKVMLGLTADADKKDVGALQKKRIAFVQSADNYNFELIENTPV